MLRYVEKVEEVFLYISEENVNLKKKIMKVLSENRINFKSITDLKELGELNRYDAVIVVGTDRDVLRLLQLMPEYPIPIFHISPPSYTTFYSSIEWEDLEEGISKLSKGDYYLEEFTRAKALVDGSKTIYALNEIALFSSRSASLVEYILSVNEETLWKDDADGIIIATPAGSTAYAFSAGGPIAMKNSNVFILVPVNSMDPMRRALIVPDNAKIKLKDIRSRFKCEVIADGITRLGLKKEVEISKAEHPAVFAKLTIKLGETIEKKAKLVERTRALPPSAKFILKILEIYGEATTKEIVEKTGLPERTIRYALATLVEKGLVKKVVNLRDTRQRIYKILKS